MAPKFGSGSIVHAIYITLLVNGKAKLVNFCEFVPGHFFNEKYALRDFHNSQEDGSGSKSRLLWPLRILRKFCQIRSVEDDVDWCHFHVCHNLASFRLFSVFSNDFIDNLDNKLNYC